MAGFVYYKSIGSIENCPLACLSVSNIYKSNVLPHSSVLLVSKYLLIICPYEHSDKVVIDCVEWHYSYANNNRAVWR